MDKKPNWFQLLANTIGLQSLVAFVIGVPSMIALVIAIWAALDPNRKIIAGLSSGLILFSICLFIYGQTRKRLYIIPNLLYKMHAITRNHANEIDLITDLKEDDFFNAYRLINIDFANMASSNTTELRALLDAFYSRYKDITIPDEDSDNFCYYLRKKSGLLNKLEQDEEYVKVLERVKQLKLSIPSEDVMEAVNKFIKASDTANSVSPFFRLIKNADKETPELFTPKIEAVLGILINNIDDEVIKALTGVRESIDKYYGRVK